MTTGVGLQTDFIDAIKDLIELDYDAVGAYETAITRLEKKDYRKKLQEFKEDHQKHIKDLTAFLVGLGKEAPRSADNTKSIMAMGKVMIGALIGDRQILNAMLSNEDDTNTAYERMSRRLDELPNSDIHKIIANGLADEIKHKAWLKEVVEATK